jgi:Predicted ATPase
MKISSVVLKKEINGLKTINMKHLGDVVVLAGRNGSGKSRLLKLLEQGIRLKKESAEGIDLSLDEKSIVDNMDFSFQSKHGDSINNVDIIPKITLINYSHYDAPLQSPDRFPPYVISTAKANLGKCDFEETARDSLLFIQYLSKYDDSEFEKFRVHLEGFGIDLKRDEDKNPKLFGLDISNSQLSPGQQYLLRMCVALYCNEIVNDNFIMLLDEPETHLHPEALKTLMEKIKEKYGNGQIWIATHSVALLSTFNSSDIWHLEYGVAKKMGSRSAPIINSLVGNEINRLQLQQLVVSPDAYACNEFAIECMTYPNSVPYSKGDPQIKLTEEQLAGEINSVVVDYGAGKGRFIDGIGMEYPKILANINYYAYDNNKCDAELCRETMQEYNIDTKNYFNDFESLNEKISSKGGADFVLMINVLHEIPPSSWEEIFGNIAELLNDKGILIIIENEELTYGEKPYDNGFLVIQEDAINLLSGSTEVKIKCERHVDKKNIVRYCVPKCLLKDVTNDIIYNMVGKIRDVALEKIREIKSVKPIEKEACAMNDDLFKQGIKLAFLLHQFANATLNLPDIKKEF